MSPDSPFHLGCPAWSVAGWKGEFLPAKVRPGEFLDYYSRALNSVEGNTSFYALPKLETAKRWATSVKDGFEFCFKVPRVISHGGGLVAAPQAVRDFLIFLDVFASEKTLGPTFLQLHESFGPSRLAELQKFCEEWPNDIPLAVEVRHADFFAGGDPQQRFEDQLRACGVDRVIFDSRALFHQPPADPAEQVAQRRKPNPPVHWTATGDRPFLRFVSGTDITKSDPWLDEAVAAVKQWLEAGKHPCIFMHVPDDRHAPSLCARFHEKLRGVLPGIPELDLAAARGEQRELF